MMMAHDSTSNGPELSTESIVALESALQKYLANQDASVSLEPTMRRIAVEARAKSIRAEQLLIMLKDIWYALPQVARADHVESQNRLLQRVVTLCIREYYSR